ncbi:hypothetical protein [Fusobacterium sp.]|uniref:hypothetical protein n=1 Tax=Fusobacterium sp. TaxID=68766 RepID=UPI002A813F0C|nr:hypothetical protein [Fusobacterium sp.]
MKKMILVLMMVVSGLCFADFQLKDMTDFRYHNAYIGLTMITPDGDIYMQVKINQSNGDGVSSLIKLDDEALRTIKKNYEANKNVRPHMLRLFNLSGDLWCTEWNSTRATEKDMIRKQEVLMQYDDFMYYLFSDDTL